MRSLSISSHSTIEPVDTTALRAHCRIQTTAEETLLGQYIKAARIELENKLKRALIPTSFLMELDDFSDTITLLYPPLSTASSDVVITYIDSSGGTATVESSVYTVDPKSEPGRIYLAYNANWPTNIRYVLGCVKIAYSAGYTTATVPENVKTWIMQRAAVMYKYRESVLDRSVNYLERRFIDGLVDDLFVYST